MAKKSKDKDDNNKVISENRRARFDYEIADTVEAGIVLTGTEVKSLRTGKASLGDSYASPEHGEIMLVNMYIPEYEEANRFNHQTRRPRKLLLSKREIHKLSRAVERQGVTIIPLRMYFNQKGIAKVLLGLGRGKKLHDKRQTEKDRSWARDKARLLRDS